MNLLERANRFYRLHGARALPKKIGAFLHRELVFPLTPDLVGIRRSRLGRRLRRRSGGVVLAGPLAGYKINPDPSWGAGDLGPMLLGTYESAILEQLVAFSSKAPALIDVGAADGYFGVGMVAKGYFDRSFCFEMDARMRRTLSNVAALNGVIDKVTVLGAADEKWTTQLVSVGADLSKSVVLCDIESAEFALLSADALRALRQCPMVIELHEQLLEDGKDQLTALVARARKYFDLRFLDQGPRELPNHEFVRDLIETDRWLLTSEGRCINQRWLILTPKKRTK